MVMRVKNIKSLSTLVCVFVFIMSYQNCGDNGKNNFGSRKPASIILIKGLSADSIAKKSRTWNWGCYQSNGEALDCTYRFVVNQSDTHEFTNEPYGNETSHTKSDGTGTFWLHLQAKDETGLESAIKSGSAKLDNTKPTVKGLSNDHITRMSQTWEWGCNDETSLSCIFQFAVTTTGPPHTFNNSSSYGITAKHTLHGGQGTYYLHIRAKDEAGNESEIKSVLVDLDNTKPVVTGLFSDNSPTKSKTWDLNCDKAPCDYRFVVNQSSNHTFSSGDSYRTVDPPTASQTNGTGVFWFHVQAKDDIGNESDVVSVSTVLDNVLPVVEGLSNDSSRRQAKTWTWGCNKNTCIYRFTASKSSTHTFQTTSNYGPIHTKTVSTTDPGIGNGPVWLHVQAKDSMNNESAVISVSAVLNDTPLTVAGLSSDPTLTKSKIWNWSCSETPASNCTYRSVVNRSATHVFPANTPYQATTTASKSSENGTWYLHVQAKSASKGESGVESISVNLDNTNPTLTGLADDETIQSSKTWTWGCSETSPSNCEYRSVINKSATHTFSPTHSSQTTTTATQNSGNGTYYLHVQARDTAGNVSNVTSVSVTLDNSGPEVTGLADDSTPAKSKTWDWSCNETSPSDCTYRFAVNKSPAHSFSTNTQYQTTTTATQNSVDGTWYLHVQVKDVANNESAVVSVSAILDNTDPELTGLADDSTPAKSKTWDWLCSNNETCTYRYNIKRCDASPPTDDDSCQTHTFIGVESYDENTRSATQSGDGTWYLHVQARDQVGNESQVTSVSVKLYSVVQSIADGPFGDHNCVLFTDNTVKCWGHNKYGQLGQGDIDNRGDDYSEVGKTDLAPINFGTKSDGAKYTAKAVSVGGHHSCALLDDNSVKCWGLNYDGQLGQGDNRLEMEKIGDTENEIQSTPTIDLGTERTALAVSAGGVNNYRNGSHTCALLDDNSVKCWGYNNHGQLGQGDRNSLGDHSNEMGDYLVAIDLGTKSDNTKHTAKAVSAGTYHTCALLDDNSVKCWGYNNYGQLGQGDRNNRGDGPNEMGNYIAAIDLGTGRTVQSISAGAYHSCALLDNNKVKCWGHNSYGQLGQGHRTHLGDHSNANNTEMGDNLLAVNLGTGRTAKAVSAGTYHSCALLDNNKVKCWGYNNYGQLGQDNRNNYGTYSNNIGNSLPVINLGETDTAQAISTGANHSCALLDNDKVKCWGRNNYGQLAQGDRYDVGTGNRDRLMENLVEIPLW